MMAQLIHIVVFLAVVGLAWWKSGEEDVDALGEPNEHGDC